MLSVDHGAPAERLRGPCASSPNLEQRAAVSRLTGRSWRCPLCDRPFIFSPFHVETPVGRRNYWRNVYRCEQQHLAEVVRLPCGKLVRRAVYSERFDAALTTSFAVRHR
jgi:hypothetical protein